MDDIKKRTEDEQRLTATAKATAKTNGVNPPPVGHPLARGSMGFCPMPTRYDWPPVPASRGYHVPEAERLRREVEKKRIKNEIISAGVAGRCSLEAEVLRELLMEGFDFPRVPKSNEEKLIALTKLNPGHCGVKREVENLLEVSSLPSPGVKNPKEELSCSLCRESSIDEKDLRSHLQGTKHQAKLAALRAKLAAKCCGTPPLANKPATPSKLSFTAAGSDDNKAKLDPGHCGVKREVENLLELPSLPSPGVKKPKEELSWSLCPESSIDEKDLRSHLHGTKHQAKVASLRAELAAKCCGTPPFANKPANPSNLSFTAAGSDDNKAKLDPGHCGVKRKVENLLEVPSLPSPGVKNPKEELSCSLCPESSIDEKDLRSHLQGTKH